METIFSAILVGGFFILIGFLGYIGMHLQIQERTGKKIPFFWEDDLPEKEKEKNEDG